ncbi:hypothetical protein U1Q18_051732 [Sarracenia purpurea var. burkii]
MRATSSFMSFEFATQLQEKTKGWEIKEFGETEGPPLQAAIGPEKSDGIRWYCEVPISIGDTSVNHLFLIGEKLNFSILIGNDAYIKYRMTACAMNDNLTWRVNGKEYHTDTRYEISSKISSAITRKNAEGTKEQEKIEQNIEEIVSDSEVNAPKKDEVIVTVSIKTTEKTEQPDTQSAFPIATEGNFSLNETTLGETSEVAAQSNTKYTNEFTTQKTDERDNILHLNLFGSRPKEKVHQKKENPGKFTHELEKSTILLGKVKIPYELEKSTSTATRNERIRRPRRGNG